MFKNESKYIWFIFYFILLIKNDHTFEEMESDIELVFSFKNHKLTFDNRKVTQQCFDNKRK